jgi:CheY-like chemotaxis protein
MSTTVSMTDTDRQAQNASERVLHRRDDNAARSGLTELVRTWGFLTDSAADGEEGLQKVSQFRPSIILTDLVMPRRTGLELLELSARSTRASP